MARELSDISSLQAATAGGSDTLAQIASDAYDVMHRNKVATAAIGAGALALIGVGVAKWGGIPAYSLIKAADEGLVFGRSGARAADSAALPWNTSALAKLGVFGGRTVAKTDWLDELPRAGSMTSGEEAVNARRIPWNQQTPDTLHQLAQDPDPEMRLEALKHPNVSGETLAHLAATDSDFLVQAEVAGNRRTPASALESLAKSSDDVIQRIVASNPSTPISGLESLLKNRSYVIRSLVAEHPNANESILSNLSQDTIIPVHVRELVDKRLQAMRA